LAEKASSQALISVRRTRKCKANDITNFCRSVHTKCVLIRVSPFTGKKVPASSRSGGKSNAGVGGKNPFQLSSASNQQQTNPFQSAQQMPSAQLPSTQSGGSLFKPSSNESSNNPFIASSFAQPTSTTNPSVSVGTKSYVQALKTKETAKDEATSKPDIDPQSGIQTIRPQGSLTDNPFAKASNPKFQSLKVPSKSSVWGPPVHHLRAQRSVPPSMDNYVVMLSVRNVDQQLCKPEVLQNHFQQFGEVVELKCMPRKSMATVAYNDYVSCE